MEEKYLEFENRLRKVFKANTKIAAKKNISCYRIYDKDLPNHPLIIDMYEGSVVVYDYESAHKLSDDEYDAWQDQCLAIIQDVCAVTEENIFLKQRKRKKNRLDQYQKNSNEHVVKHVHENGIVFKLNLSDYLDTGLFLDHRPTRKWLMDKVNGARVLNLFCYTGSFSLYAAAGGASQIWSIDLSNNYIAWCQENYALNSFVHQPVMKWIKADVLQYISELPRGYFDWIVCDPPTFSNSKMMQEDWDVQAHHTNLLLQLKLKLTVAGQIIFSTNARKFILDEDLHNHFIIKDMTGLTTDFDFQGKLQRKCYLLKKL
jgi:23S rRNA (cytosine1962-C5)-methyltransferase